MKILCNLTPLVGVKAGFQDTPHLTAMNTNRSKYFLKKSLH